MSREKTVFSPFQIFTLCAVSTGLGTLCFSPFLGSGADAAWPYAVLIAAVFSSLMTVLYMRSVQKLGAGSFDTLLSDLLHPAAARVILALVGLFFAVQSALTAYITADAIGMYLLEHTPRGAILLVIIFTACVVHDSGLKYTSRCCELLLMAAAIPLIVLLAVCLLNIDLREAAVIIQPEASDIIAQLPAAILSCSSAAAIVFSTGHRLGSTSRAVLGYFCAAAISIILFICTVGIFTAEGAAIQKFPFIEMARSVSTGTVSLTERFDAIFISVMFIAAILQLSLLGGCSTHCLAAAFGLRSQKSFTWLLLPFVFAAAYYAEYRSFANILMQTALRGTVILLIAVPVTVFIAVKLIKKGADNVA